jgi:hypothetical protein
MWVVILATIVVAFLMLKSRETFFVLKAGNPFDGEDLISFDADAKGTRIFGIWPYTCPRDRSDYDAGLCYPQCDDGYNGVGPVCWAHTKSRGIGRLVRFKSCSEMGLGPDYRDDPLSCWKDLKCTSRCTSNKRDLFGNCYAWHLKISCSGPDLKWKTPACPGPRWAGNTEEHTSLKDLLCYKECPKDKPKSVPGMPYLCMKGERGLGYGRGVGRIPPIFAFGP